jgi:hypothetical protein
MKVLNVIVRASAYTLGTTVKTSVALSHFLISKVIGAGGSVTIQSLLLASNAIFLYAGEHAPTFALSHGHLGIRDAFPTAPWL